MMSKTALAGLVVVGLSTCTISEAVAVTCQSYWTAQYKCMEGCGPCAGAGNNSYYDNGAVQRARAAAAARQQAAAAAAEEQRNHDAEVEQQRVEAETKRRAEDMARQAQFIDDRNAAASTLRGSSGTASPDALRASGLRGTSVTPALRGLRPDTSGTSNLDPSVVDARHVPTGLPKSVEAEIPHTPAGDRVRKGFQAIMAHDWSAAHAWFQDALNHDPGNAGIQRLVDLAEYTLNRERSQRGLTASAKPVVGMAQAFGAFNRSHPQPPPMEIKPNWKAFFNALFTKNQRYPAVSAVRG